MTTKKRVVKAELSLNSHGTRDKSQSCSGAWWYEDWNCIRVYASPKGNNPVLSFRIDRAALEAWLNRRSAALAVYKRRRK